MYESEQGVVRRCNFSQKQTKTSFFGNLPIFGVSELAQISVSILRLCWRLTPFLVGIFSCPQTLLTMSAIFAKYRPKCPFFPIFFSQNECFRPHTSLETSPFFLMGIFSCHQTLLRTTLSPLLANFPLILEYLSFLHHEGVILSSNTPVNDAIPPS